MNYRKFSKEIEQKVLSSYQQEIPIADILQKFDLSSTTFRRILKRNGITPTRQKRIEFKLKDNNISEQDIIKFYLENNSQYACASKFHISKSTLYKILQKNNIDRRSFYESNRIHQLDTSYFETIDTEDKAYFLGLLIADGYNSNTFIKIALQKRDIDILEKFKHFTSYAGNLILYKKRNPKHSDLICLQFSSKKMCEDLSKHGCIKNKSHSTFFPDIPEELHHHFVRGVFDGDGSIYITKRSVCFRITGNIKLIESINNILSKYCNITASKIRVENRCKDNIVYINYTGKQSISKIYAYLYNNSTVYMNRKYEKFNEYFSINK